MRRVLIVNKSIAPYHKELYEHAAAAMGADVEVLILLPTDGKLVCAKGAFDRSLVIPQGDNIEVRVMPGFPFHMPLQGLLCKGGDWGRYSILPDRDLIRAIREFAPDITWIHELSPYVLPALMAAKMRRRPVVMSTEVGRSMAKGFPLHIRGMHTIGGALVDGVIANSHTATEPLSARQNNVVQAFHAVDSQRYTKACSPSGGDGRLQLVALGHIIPRKGIDLLFEAMAAARERGVEVNARLIGGGEIDWAKAEADRCDVSSSVEFAGFLQDEELRSALADADAFVLPSRLDTYAAVCHEAACVGLPLLISKHAGASNTTVDPGENGFVIDPQDTADFADKLCRMAAEGEALQAFSRRSREIGEELCARRNGARVAGWLRETVSGRASAKHAPQIPHPA